MKSKTFSRRTLKTPEAETILWKNILKNGKIKKYHFQKQSDKLNDTNGLFCKDLMLVLKINSSKESAVKKRNEDKALNALGLKVLRFNEKEILNEPENVKEVLHSYINQFIQLYQPSIQYSMSRPQKAIYYVW